MGPTRSQGKRVDDDKGTQDSTSSAHKTPQPNCSSHCCAQQTGMHIRCGSTAYSLAILPRKRPDTYRHKKTLGRAPVSPDIAGPCPAEPFPAGSHPAGSHLSRSIPAEGLRVATETRPTRNIFNLSTSERRNGKTKAEAMVARLEHERK